MAERRPPGFNVPLGFYDGPEVKSIPRRIRAAAVGVWTLCGTFSANKLQDGYVDAETLKDLGCTPAIRAALMATKGPDGELDPLWIDARDGGIQFTKWSKYQRSSAEVKAYRDAEAARKRTARKANVRATNTHCHAEVNPIADTNSSDSYAEDNYPGSAATSNDSKTSGRTTGGHPPDHRDPSTKTETKTDVTHLTNQHAPNVGGDERGLTEPVSPSASRLVATLIPDTIPAAVRTGLRLRTSELMTRDGVDSDTAAETLRRWLAKPGAGVGLLPALAADVIRERAAPAGQPHKMRVAADLAQRMRAEEQAQFATGRKELA